MNVCDSVPTANGAVAGAMVVVVVDEEVVVPSSRRRSRRSRARIVRSPSGAINRNRPPCSEVLDGPDAGDDERPPSSPLLHEAATNTATTNARPIRTRTVTTGYDFAPPSGVNGVGMERRCDSSSDEACTLRSGSFTFLRCGSS